MSKAGLKKRRKVFVGVSGGVDSSVSAALLKEAGYDVTAVFIKAWHPEWLSCDWRAERRDAMRVASHLRIPFITLDLEKEYKKSVVDVMIRDYSRGLTPNPDVLCNKEIKFGHFLKFAKEYGADYVATGHYAQIKCNENKKFELHRGVDEDKDQSYFLWTLNHAQLEHVLFPIGHLRKTEVRALANRFKLPTATKKDSQGLCFLGHIDLVEFLSHFVQQKKGTVINEEGVVVGTHPGAHFLTIGQRHGLSISNTSTNSSPYYIIGKDMKKNIVYVSHNKNTNVSFIKKVQIIDKNFHNIEDKGNLKAQIRYRQKPFSVESYDAKNSTINFKESQPLVALGQSVVIYEGDRLIGGGTIVKLF
jgi:tRNA-uridine 2-sulfurtransferase